MPYHLRPQEFKGVSALPGPDRYQHFVQRVADREEVWGLASDDGWVMVGDDEERQCIPFWPHPDYASALVVGDWSSNKPKPISLEDFLGKCLPGMAKNGTGVAVFPTPEMKGIVVEPLRLKRDLEELGEEFG